MASKQASAREWVGALHDKADTKMQAICARFNVNAKFRHPDDGTYTTPLVFAITEHIPAKRIASLLAAGADPNVLVDGDSALDVAHRFNRKGIAQALMKAGARRGEDLAKERTQKHVSAESKRKREPITSVHALAEAVSTKNARLIQDILDDMLLSRVEVSPAFRQEAITRGLRAAWDARDIAACRSIVTKAGPVDALSLESDGDLLAHAIREDAQELIKTILSFQPPQDLGPYVAIALESRNAKVARQLREGSLIALRDTLLPDGQTLLVKAIVADDHLTVEALCGLSEHLHTTILYEGAERTPFQVALSRGNKKILALLKQCGAQ